MHMFSCCNVKVVKVCTNFQLVRLVVWQLHLNLTLFVETDFGEIFLADMWQWKVILDDSIHENKAFIDNQ